MSATLALPLGERAVLEALRREAHPLTDDDRALREAPGLGPRRRSCRGLLRRGLDPEARRGDGPPVRGADSDSTRALGARRRELPRPPRARGRLHIRRATGNRHPCSSSSPRRSVLGSTTTSLRNSRRCDNNGTTARRACSSPGAHGKVPIRSADHAAGPNPAGRRRGTPPPAPQPTLGLERSRRSRRRRRLPPGSTSDRGESACAGFDGIEQANLETAGVQERRRG